MTTAEVLSSLAAKKITVEIATGLLAAINAESRPKANLYCKVSPKGALSVYGLQQMPVTLYVEQWERLLAGAPADHFVLAFIKQWEGKEYKGEHGTAERNGKKVPYVAKLTRKAA